MFDLGLSPKGRTSDTSAYALSQRRRAEYYQVSLHREGEEWTIEEEDLLLEGALVHQWKFWSHGPCYCRELHRTEESIKTQLWKLAVKYADSAAGHYQPRQRTDRTKEPFSDADRAFAERTLGHGRKYVFDFVTHLSNLLARDRGQVLAWLWDLARRMHSPLAGPLPASKDERQLCHLAAKAVAGACKNLLKKARQ